MANSQKSMDAEKATREEAETKAKEDMEKMKKEHFHALVKARDEGFKEAIFGAADGVDGLKNKIYKAGYEFGLDSFITELCYVFLGLSLSKWHTRSRCCL